MPPKGSAQLELELPAATPEEGPPAAPGPPRRVRAASEARRSRPGRLRLWTAVAALVALMVLGSLAFYQLDQFLASAPHFILRGGAEHSGLRLEGARYVSRAKLFQVFAQDFGRSVYLIPLEARRQALLGVDWVREARIGRHWPNRILVSIAERTPVAFVVVASAANAPARTALIDAEGVILDLPERANFQFPVLLGLSRQQPASLRRERVRLFLDFLRSAGPVADQISEVDLADPDNLKVTALVEGVPVRLWLGNANFRARLDNFLSSYAEIRRLLPHTSAFDLRLERRITVLKGGARGR